MKSRLQSKEFFLPLATGADTESDPRLPTAGVLTVENGDFTVKGSVKKRDALATMVGTVSTDTPSALPSGAVYMGSHDEGSTLVFFGEDVHEYVELGNYVNSFSTNSAGAGRVVDIDTNPIYTLQEAVGIGHADFALANSSNTQEESDLMYMTKTGTTAPGLGNIRVVGEESGRIKAQTTVGRKPHAIWAGTDDYAYAIEYTSTLNVINWDRAAQTLTSDSLGAITNGTNAGTHGVYVGTINGTKRAAYVHSATNTTGVIHNVDIETPALKATAYRTLGAANTDQSPSIQVWDSANAQVLASWGSYTNNNANGVLHRNFSMETLTDTGLTQNHTGSFTDTVLSATGRCYHCSVIKDSATTGRIIYTHRGTTANGTMPLTVMRQITNITGGTITIGSAVEMCRGAFPRSLPFQDDDGNWYQFWQYAGGRWWHTSATTFDQFSPQNFAILMRFTGSTTAYEQVIPVGYALQGRPWSDDTRLDTTTPIREYTDYTGTARKSWTMNVPLKDKRQTTDTAVESQVFRMDVDFGRQDLRPIEHDRIMMVPGAMPYAYDGRDMRPMGSAEYPEGLALTINSSGGGSANWSESGGTGVYTYTCTFIQYDAHGREIESANTPAVSANVTATDHEVDLTIHSPHLAHLRSIASDSQSPFIRLYRSTKDSNNYFELTRIAPDFTADEVSYTDIGTTNVGSDLGSSALYISAGELENTQPRAHRVSEVHQDRYFYVDREDEETTIWYSKAIKARISPEFSDALNIICSSNGGRIFALRSHQEKLYIFKRNSIYVTYGTPLNDAGSGSGYEPPRIVSREVGLQRATAAAVGQPGIIFVNSADGDIYLLAGEQTQFIGGPVRHYTRQYEYDNVFFAPQDSSVYITSDDSGAPTLVFNYRYSAWSTFTGRYDGSIAQAFSARPGRGHGFGTGPLNVVLDNDRKVYIQEPDGGNTYALNESYNLDISSSWIPLNDMLGYGRFYKWTLLMGKPKDDLEVLAYTAYDSDPYWADSVTIDTSAITAYDSDLHYGTMTDNGVVDQTFKYEMDGSRHKTDSVRIRVKDNNPTIRGNLEVIGARIEVGVKPGNTRLGINRSVG